MSDLSTNYLGLKLKNPLVASASPLSREVQAVRQIEEAGASALVMFSLFEEQIAQRTHELDHFLYRGIHPGLVRYYPDREYTLPTPDEYLNLLHQIKQTVKIPVIASLNGVSAGKWLEFARKLQEAGADALEVNIYYVPTDPKLTGATLEDAYVELVKAAHAQVTIPITVKLTPFHTSLPSLVDRLADAGAQGVVLFNRFYQPDFDLETLDVVSRVHLSSSDDLRLPMRWIAILSPNARLDLALSSGVHSAQDVVKGIMAGASVTMLTSELLQHGIGSLRQILTELNTWLDAHEYPSVDEMRGRLSQSLIAEPASFERANYIKALNTFS